MIFKEDLGTGYMYCYDPSSPYANGSGKVMEHVYVMSISIGRMLKDGEVVHHKDRDRKNNNLSNLQLMTTEDHARLHALEDKNQFKVDVNCSVCGKIFKCGSSEDRLFCSTKCSSLSQRKFNPTKEELKEMVWKYPTTSVAKFYGVSDVAVSRRCKSMGIDKPPRGYWTQVKSKQI